MGGVVLIDNFVGAEMHEDGTVGLDCLIEAGSHNVSWDDLSIWDCMCWKRDIFTLRASIKCSINCISLFNVFFLHC